MDDIMSTKFSKQRNYYRNGQLHEETPLRDGRFHGIARLWHENGTQATHEAYQNDLRHGLCRQWNDEGKLLGEYRMDHGTGIQRVWFDNGIVQQERSFFKGKATGPCRMWLRDGSFASEEWYIEYREVSKAQFAKAATKHPEWPPDPKNGTTHRKLPRATLKKRAHRLNCKWLLAQSDTKDAAKWLEEAKMGTRVVGSLSGRRTRNLVRDALAAGARRVLVMDIYASKEGKEFADELLVQLPQSKTHRALVRSVFTSLAGPTACGLRPDVDSGHSWLYVYVT
jgi:hypothetical protein